jgi:hypothetical protein
MAKIICVSLPTKSQEVEQNGILLFCMKIPLSCADGVKKGTMHGKTLTQGVVEHSLGGRWLVEQIVVLHDCQLVEIINFANQQVQGQGLY